MFNKFTDEARAAVVDAQESARALGHCQISQEHLMLGLVEQDEMSHAVQALTGSGVSIVRLALCIEERMPATENQEPPKWIPFDNNLRTVIFDRTFREGLQLGRETFSTGHMLLSLLHKSSGGVAPEALREFGVEYEMVRAAVQALSSSLTNHAEVNRGLEQKPQETITLVLPEQIVALREQFGDNSPEFNLAMSEWFSDRK